MGFLTPEMTPEDTVLRVLKIPASKEWLSLVGGALAPLFFSSSWDEHGAVTPAEASNTAKQLIMESFYGGSGMIGAIVPYATEEIPPLLLPCNGSSYSADDYPLLYARLPSTLKFGDGMFLTPNLGGRTIVGAGANTGLTTRAPFATGGEERHTLTISEMPRHDHGLSQVLSPRDTEPGIAISVWVSAPANSATTRQRGNDDPHNNMQPYYVLNYGIVFA